MDYDSVSKRRLFGALSWVVIGIWIILNFTLSFAGVPLQTLIIVLPIVNILLIVAWIFTRTLYNISNSKVKHDKKMELRVEDTPLPKYGSGEGEDYIPNVTVDSELFKQISTESEEGVLLDVSLGDYLKPGKVIIFHDGFDYGMRKEVKVLKVETHDTMIETFFAPTR